MNRMIRNITRSAFSILVMICVWGAGAAFSQTPALKQRAVPAKPSRTFVNPAKVRTDVVVVKFREGTRVRERAGQFQADLTGISDSEERLLQRANLPRQRLFQELAQVNAAIAPNSRRHVRRLFTRPEAVLDAEKRDGELRIAEELADLNLYYFILIENANPADTGRLVDQLNAMAIVEAAYPQPIAQEAQTDRAPVTADMTSQQGYLKAAFNGSNTTNGIDADYARFFPGTRGAGVNIIDIERGWNLVHEDLPPVFFQAGPNLGHPSRQHGTAVLGVMAAGENGYGMTGIVPQSRIGVSSAVANICVLPGLCFLVDDFENAVNRSTANLRAGDIMLIEQHAPGPDSGLTAFCNPDQFEFIAMEFWNANFDAIKNATAKGIVVVEAAGNGEMDLDSPIYDGKFDRSVRDSGAIIVGAGSSAGRAPLCFTNFGSRVDLQGWGQNVATLGDRDLSGSGVHVNGNDDTQWYRTDFGGTSSASPIVAGAAASIQGFRKARGLGTFGSIQMRNFLIQTGVAQAADPRHIGPLPNLKAAIDAHAPKRTLKVTFLSVKVVDNLFAGPQQLSFNFTVNNKFAQFPAAGLTASFPQATAVSLPASLNLTTQEILDEGMVVHVSTTLKSQIFFDPKTFQVTVGPSRPIRVIRFFPTGTSYNDGIFFGGSKTFTDRSTNANGFFEITYRVEVVTVIYAP